MTDQGVVEGRAGSTLRLRSSLGAERVRIWADVNVKHSGPLGARQIEDEARDLESRGLADAVLVTGEGTGRAVDTVELGAVRRAVKVPVLAASGATIDGLGQLAAVCDGVIVGSALRADGQAGGPIDAEKARRFAHAFRGVFGR